MTVTTSIKTLAFASLLALAPAQMMAAQKGGTFTTGDKTFLLNGKPFVVKAAELHYPRIPRAYWEHRIKSDPELCERLGLKTGEETENKEDNEN
jgi:beta-galactosidase